MKKLILFLVICISTLSCADYVFFDNEPTTLAIVTIPNKAYKLKLEYHPSNAVHRGSIQINKVSGAAKTTTLY